MSSARFPHRVRRALRSGGRGRSRSGRLLPRLPQALRAAGAAEVSRVGSSDGLSVGFEPLQGSYASAAARHFVARNVRGRTRERRKYCCAARNEAALEGRDRSAAEKIAGRGDFECCARIGYAGHCGGPADSGRDSAVASLFGAESAAPGVC